MKIYKATSSDTKYPIYVVARNLFDAMQIIQSNKVVSQYSIADVATERAHDILDIRLISDFAATIWVDPAAVK